ncbi:uncharacterized protein LOC143607795 [Bidens hawaiensis]|uniref:uncharacterized protein LOC143607795 n=1 Tax=Bidens hawaiensis TaxID=980011 RepID=UPI00404B225A
MMIALSAKNKIGFINNTLTMPEYEQQLKIWQRCNDLVISWILNTLTRDISDSVLYAEASQILWNELNSRYGQANGAKFFQFQKNLCQSTQGRSNISTYGTIGSNILMMQPIPSISSAYGILMQDEKQNEIHTTIDFTTTSASTSERSGAPTSGGIGENRRTLACTHCKKNGHSVNKKLNFNQVLQLQMLIIMPQPSIKNLSEV